MSRVAIVGMTSTPWAPSRRDLSLHELGFSASRGALDDAGVARADIDDVVLAAHDLVDGRGIANMSGAGPAGAYMKSETRTPGDGLLGLILGATMILAGGSDLILVVSWAKSSEGFDDAVTATEYEPFAQRPAGLCESTALALQATELIRRRGEASRAAASAAVARDRAHGADNPCATLREAVAPRAVVEAPSVAWPLTELDLPPRSDGACALVLASERRATSLTREPIWIEGMAWSSDENDIGGRDLTRLTSLERAVASALGEAGLGGSDEVGLVEYAARSSFQHELVLEGLGLSRPGGAAADLVRGGGDDWPLLNLSGGLACTGSTVATGLLGAYSAAAAMRETDVSSALVHASYGPCAQSNAVVVLGGGSR